MNGLTTKAAKATTKPADCSRTSAKETRPARKPGQLRVNQGISAENVTGYFPLLRHAEG